MFGRTKLKPGPTQCFGVSARSEGFGDLGALCKTLAEVVRAAAPLVEGFSDMRKRNRRTDAEFSSDSSELDRTPRDFQYQTDVPLSEACHLAEHSPGVYVLYLNGAVMKCGRAAYAQGVAWRFKQYYNLNYDKKSQEGDTWSVSAENRDLVTVSWQCCPVSK